TWNRRKSGGSSFPPIFTGNRPHHAYVRVKFSEAVCMANVVCSPVRTMRFVHQWVVALIAICSVAASASAQTTVTLSTPGRHISADLTIQGGASGWTDFSNSDTIATKVSSADYTRRIMLKFNTEDFIPANAVIQSAQLVLVLKSAESTESRPLT